MSKQLSEHAAANREHWTSAAVEFGTRADAQWSGEPAWGIWGIPETELGVFAGIERWAGCDVVELGCGTGYVSGWLARAGARPVGIDVTPAQLATAREMQVKHGIEFPLIEASAEAVPLPDASFDFAISEYGASIWCDPYLWIPEAARLLRPGGELVFLVNSVQVMLCVGADFPEDRPASVELQRDLFGLHRCEWDDDNSVEFHLPHGKLIDLLRETGFEVEQLIEVQAPADAKSDYGWVTLDWARRWPTEEVWRVRKVG